MLFSFKQKSQDFIVSEELPWALSGQGDAFYVCFEKRNMTTMEVVQHLCSKFKISRLTLGIAGLKDKRAITRQRISIYDKALKKLGGERAFVEGVAEVAKVLKTGRHETPLNLSTPIHNTFHIRLRAQKKLGVKEKDLAKAGIDKLFATGFPNIFGDQRFGIEGANRKKGKDIIQGRSTIKEKKEIVFKLQALASKFFNEYVAQRAKDTFTLVDGDILQRTLNGQIDYGVYRKKLNVFLGFNINTDSKEFFVTPQQLSSEEIPFDPKTMIVTGPVIGENLLLPRENSDAGKLETAFLSQRKLNAGSLKAFIDNKVRGLRRPLRVMPTNTSVTYQEDDLLIRFTLPSGAYASVLIDEMMERLER